MIEYCRNCYIETKNDETYFACKILDGDKCEEKNCPGTRSFKKDFFNKRKKKEKSRKNRDKHINQFLRTIKRIQKDRNGGYISDKLLEDELGKYERGEDLHQIGSLLTKTVKRRSKRKAERKSRKRNKKIT